MVALWYFTSHVCFARINWKYTTEIYRSIWALPFSFFFFYKFITHGGCMCTRYACSALFITNGRIQSYKNRAWLKGGDHVLLPPAFTARKRRGKFSTGINLEFCRVAARARIMRLVYRPIWMSSLILARLARCNFKESDLPGTRARLYIYSA